MGNTVTFDIVGSSTGGSIQGFGFNGQHLTISLGDTVFPGQKIAEIPDLSTLEAKVYVLEADAGGLKPGIAARLVLEGQTGREYRATVSRVDAMAKTRRTTSASAATSTSMATTTCRPRPTSASRPATRTATPSGTDRHRGHRPPEADV